MPLGVQMCFQFINHNYNARIWVKASELTIFFMLIPCPYNQIGQSDYSSNAGRGVCYRNNTIRILDSRDFSTVIWDSYCISRNEFANIGRLTIKSQAPK